MTLNTHSQLTTPPLSLTEIHRQLSQEMTRLTKANPALYDEAARLFKDNQDARTQVGAASILLQEVLALSQPPLVTSTDAFSALFDLEVDVPLPGHAPVQHLPVFEAAPEALTFDAIADPDPLPLDNDALDMDAAADVDEIPDDGLIDVDAQEDPTSDVGEDESEVGGDEPSEAGEDEAKAEDVQDAAETEEVSTVPVVVPAQIITWAEGTLGDGLLSQLAQTLQSGDMLSLVLTRRKDELLVTVMPKPGKNELAATAIPLQVCGTPKLLDRDLAGALEGYKAGRRVARDVAANDYAQAVQSAADASRKASAAAKAKATSKPGPAATPKPAPAEKAPLTGVVFAQVRPKDALLVLSDKAGKTYPIQTDTKTTLPLGDYTLTADAPEHLSATATFTLKAGKEEKPALVLPRAAQPSIF